MNDEDLKDLFGAMVVGGPADLLDVDRAVVDGRRRRRGRAAATLASVAAAVAVLAGFLTLGVPHQDSAPPVAPTAISSAPETPTPTPTPTSSWTPSGDANEDWAIAVQDSLPYRDQLRGSYLVAFPMHPWDGSSGAEYRRATDVTTAFHYTDGGRTTGLIVQAYSPGTYGPTTGTASEILLGSCGIDQACEVRDSASGPVLVSRGSTIAFGTMKEKVDYVRARSLRSSGILVVVTSYSGDTDRYGRVLTSNGAPGMALDLDRLIATATGIPEPPLALRPPPATWPPPAVARLTTPSPLVVVRSGRAHRLGAGASMTVTDAKVCVTVAGGAGPACEYTGGLHERDVSKDVVPIRGGAGGYVVFGRFGMSDAGVASIVVTTDGRSRVATLVKAGAGDPHLAYYVVLPPGTATPSPTVEAFHTGGELMAQNLAG